MVKYWRKKHLGGTYEKVSEIWRGLDRIGIGIGLLCLM